VQPHVCCFVVVVSVPPYNHFHVSFKTLQVEGENQLAEKK
jgi:hypothetical protein